MQKRNYEKIMNGADRVIAMCGRNIYHHHEKFFCAQYIEKHIFMPTRRTELNGICRDDLGLEICNNTIPKVIRVSV